MLITWGDVSNMESQVDRLRTGFVRLGVPAMMHATHVQTYSYQRRDRASRGFTLVELMVAIMLGILVSIGLVTLFSATSKANRVQDALAQLQENGRYAINRLNYDLRLESRQLMSASGFLASAPGTNGAVNPVLAPQVYVGDLPFPGWRPWRAADLGCWRHDVVVAIEPAVFHRRVTNVPRAAQYLRGSGAPTAGTADRSTRAEVGRACWFAI